MPSLLSKGANQGFAYGVIGKDVVELAGIVALTGLAAPIVGPLVQAVNIPLRPAESFVVGGATAVIGSFAGPLPDLPRFETSGDYRNGNIMMMAKQFISLTPLGFLTVGIPNLAVDVVCLYAGEEIGRALKMR